MKNFNLTRKQIVIALGVVSALIYLAPFRQQAVNHNHCVEHMARDLDLNQYGADTPKRRANHRALAYGRCA